MKQYLATIFEDVRHERSLNNLLSLTDPDLIKKFKFTDDEVNIIKTLALQNLQRQRMLTENFALQLLE